MTSAVEHSNPPLWVDTARLSFHCLPRPQAPRRKWEQLLPWMMEDFVLGTPDELHFAVLAYDAESVWVAVVDREQLEQWRDAAESRGQHWRSMVPDVLVLPWEEGEIRCCLQPGSEGRSHRWLVRHGRHVGMAVPESLLGEVLTRLHAEGNKTLIVHGPETGALASFDIERHEPAPDWTAPTDVEGSLLDSPRGSARGAGHASRLGRACTALLLLTVLLAGGWVEMGNRQLNAEVGRLTDARREWLAQYFDDIERGGADVTSRIEARVHAGFVQRRQFESLVMRQVAVVDAMLADCGCELRAATLDGEIAVLDIVNGGGDEESLSLPEGIVREQRETIEGGVRLTLGWEAAR